MIVHDGDGLTPAASLISGEEQTRHPIRSIITSRTFLLNNKCLVEMLVRSRTSLDSKDPWLKFESSFGCGVSQWIIDF